MPFRKGQSGNPAGRKPGAQNRRTTFKLMVLGDLAQPARRDAETRRAARAYRYEKTYGISMAQYEAMLQAQGGKCAACGAADPGHATGVFFVDHNHTTGNVRELVCSTCNWIAGFLETHPDRVVSVQRYLARHCKEQRLSNAVSEG